MISRLDYMGEVPQALKMCPQGATLTLTIKVQLTEKHLYQKPDEFSQDRVCFNVISCDADVEGDGTNQALAEAAKYNLRTMGTGG